MERGFQKSLQLFVANGNYVFKDDVCVDLSGVLYGKPNYANVPFSKLFVGPYVDRPEVMAEGPDHVTTLISEFCASVSCPPMLAPFGVVAVKV